MELMSDYQKATNFPFMEAIELDPIKNKDYLEVISNPIWLRKSKYLSFLSLLNIFFFGFENICIKIMHN